MIPDYINLFTETDGYDFKTLLDSCKKSFKELYGGSAAANTKPFIVIKGGDRSTR